MKWKEPGRHEAAHKVALGPIAGFKEGTLMSILYFMSVHSNMILERGNLWSL